MGPLLDLVQLISQWMALRVTGGEQIDFKCGKIRKHNHDFAGLFCLRHKNNYNPSGGYSKVVSLAKHSISCYQVLDPWSLKNPESCVTRICPPGISLAPVVISRPDLDNSDSVWHTGYLYHVGPAQRL